MTLPDYIAIARANWRWHGKPPGIFQKREQMAGRIAPFGNRKQPVLWAQITDAGQDYLLELRQAGAGRLPEPKPELSVQVWINGGQVRMAANNCKYTAPPRTSSSRRVRMSFSSRA